MAKKQKVDDSKNFNLALRKYALDVTMGSVNQIKEKIDDLEEAFSKVYVFMEEFFNEIEGEIYKEKYFSEFNIDFFKIFFGYLEDITFMKSKSDEEDKKSIRYIKDRIIKEYGLMERPSYLMYMAVNEISGALCRIGKRHKNINFIDRITDTSMAFAMYITTFIMKFKNKTFIGIDERDGLLQVRYGKGAVVSKESIDLILYGIPQKDNIKYFDEFNHSVLINFTKLQSILLLEDRSVDYHRNVLSVTSQIDPCKMLLYGEDEEMPNNFYGDIMKNRKYAIHKDGIILEQNHKYIKSTKIVEKEENFHITLLIKNKDEEGKSFLEIAKTQLDKPLCPNEVEMSFIVSKDKISMTDFTKADLQWYIDKMSSVVLCTSHVIYSDTNLMYVFLTSIRFYCMNILYEVFCRLKTLKNVKIYNQSSCGKNVVNFRMCHLRRLPKGWSASHEAIARAKAEGFLNIPEGTTFVRSFGMEEFVEN